MNRTGSHAATRRGDRVVAQDGELGRVDRILRYETAGPV
jgi:hypothetical protein